MSEERESLVAENTSDLGRQVVETRNQMIKTANIVGNLSAELRELTRQQQRLSRGRTLSSFAAYGVFLFVVAGAFYFTYRSRIERVIFEKDVMVRQHAAAKNKLHELERAILKRQKAEDQAAAFYRLIEAGRLRQAIQRYPEVSQLPLSKVEAAVFRDWIERKRNRVAHTAYSLGMRAAGDKSFKRAAYEFRRSLKMVPSPPYAAALHYYLGVSLMNLGNNLEAAEALERALKKGAEKTVARDLRFYLGRVYQQLARRRKAIETYRLYVKRFPMTRQARVARRRIKALSK